MDLPVGTRWRNGPQTNSLIAGSLIFVAGGMDFALGLGWNLNTGIDTTLQFRWCWFIGAIGGSLFAMLFTKVVKKMFFYILGGLLLLAVGVLYTVGPTSYSMVLTARYISGAAVGFTRVPFIIHSGEIAVRTYRGTCTSLEQSTLALGVAIQVIYVSQWTQANNYPSNRLHGILIIVFSALAICFSVITIESPIYYLQRNDEDMALKCQECLVREPEPSELTLETFAESQAYVSENESGTMGRSFWPFIKVLLYRLFAAFGFSLSLSLSLVYASNVTEQFDYTWPGIVYGILYLFGSIFGLILLDTAGRKLYSMVSLVIMGALMLGMAGIYNDSANTTDVYYMDVIIRLTLTYAFFAGAFSSSTSTYLSEAFSMRSKPFLIALAISCEQILHIIVIVSISYDVVDLYSYFMAVGIILVLGMCFFAGVMPETRNLTLRQAELRFRWKYDIVAY